MTDIEFGELPPNPKGGRPGEWLPTFEALRSKPGEWAKVRTLPSGSTAASTAQNLKLGKYHGSSPGEFEATQRGTDVWARYVGIES